ncbi:uncharacterized protein PHALS_02045 [Plasmopara halstedii]|uniref:Uncharacterized protein n=1 Tax=Plasmopara halstedii TaxID=4781 RepID=A0A0N7L710_PLAHL|nr:uncharacterized protein PHALS_02045 [Plasmopara halstedii]CEG45771.1 hypothetical protein PHALS_02045 [Plasmopara halstedii]|eukprot:XP_024582140.1 hypothetical protein PHALS_02045 [Plasmopara halstedii]
MVEPENDCRTYTFDQSRAKDVFTFKHAPVTEISPAPKYLVCFGPHGMLQYTPVY